MSLIHSRSSHSRLVKNVVATSTGKHARYQLQISIDPNSLVTIQTQLDLLLTTHVKSGLIPAFEAINLEEIDSRLADPNIDSEEQKKLLRRRNMPYTIHLYDEPNDDYFHMLFSLIQKIKRLLINTSQGDAGTTCSSDVRLIPHIYFRQNCPDNTNRYVKPFDATSNFLHTQATNSMYYKKLKNIVAHNEIYPLYQKPNQPHSSFTPYIFVANQKQAQAKFDESQPILSGKQCITALINYITYKERFFRWSSTSNESKQVMDEMLKLLFPSEEFSDKKNLLALLKKFKATQELSHARKDESSADVVTALAKTEKQLTNKLTRLAWMYLTNVDKNNQSTQFASELRKVMEVASERLINPTYQKPLRP